MRTICLKQVLLGELNRNSQPPQNVVSLRPADLDPLFQCPSGTAQPNPGRSVAEDMLLKDRNDLFETLTNLCTVI